MMDEWLREDMDEWLREDSGSCRGSHKEELTYPFINSCFKTSIYWNQEDARHHARPWCRIEDKKAEVISAFTEPTVYMGKQTNKYITTI